MTRAFIDTNVPMYSVGAEHAAREGATRVLAAIASGDLDAVTDSEVLQEILHRYLPAPTRAMGLAIFDFFYRLMLGRVLPIDPIDVQSARDLSDRYPHLTARDLLHLAVMIRHQVPVIITADMGFDSVSEVRRIDPAGFAGQV